MQRLERDRIMQHSQKQQMNEIKRVLNIEIKKGVFIKVIAYADVVFDVDINGVVIEIVDVSRISLGDKFYVTRMINRNAVEIFLMNKEYEQTYGL